MLYHPENKPVRVRVQSGAEKLPGIAADPDGAKPHIGRLGWMTMEVHPDFGLTNPRIELDGGGVIWGCECWWERVDDEEVEAGKVGDG